jgi:hypothetical protein|tara:strand:- start:225 stop:641 length:417 start_codon:yes stop_codon:yes gene_type:complete
MIRSPNQIDKRMSSGGPEEPRLDMNKFIELADAEKIEADALNELFEAIQEKFKNERKPGEPFDSWLNRTPREELIKISLANGGKVIDLAQYRKSKEPAQVKKINLSDYFDLGRSVSSLNDSERETLKWLLNKTLYPKD